MKFRSSTLLLLAATCSLGVQAQAGEKAGNYFNNDQETIVVAAAKGHRNKRPNHGKAKSKTTQVQRRDNGYKRSTEITDGQGRQYNRDATVTREAGSKTRDVLWTGPDGQTATRQDIVTRTDDGYTRNSEFTGPKGKTATRDATVARDSEAGTRTRDVLWTGPDGQTVTGQDVVTRTDDGYSRSTTHTGPEGNTSERQVISAWDPETKTWTKQVTYDRYDFDQD